MSTSNVGSHELQAVVDGQRADEHQPEEQRARQQRRREDIDEPMVFRRGEAGIGFRRRLLQPSPAGEQRHEARATRDAERSAPVAAVDEEAREESGHGAAETVCREQQHGGDASAFGRSSLRHGRKTARQCAPEEDTRDETRSHERVLVDHEGGQRLGDAESQQAPQDDPPMSVTSGEEGHGQQPGALTDEIRREDRAQLGPAQRQRLRDRRSQRPHQRGNQAVEEVRQRAGPDEQQCSPIQAEERRWRVRANLATLRTVRESCCPLSRGRRTSQVLLM